MKYAECTLSRWKEQPDNEGLVLVKRHRMTAFIPVEFEGREFDIGSSILLDGNPVTHWKVENMIDKRVYSETELAIKEKVSRRVTGVHSW